MGPKNNLVHLKSLWWCLFTKSWYTLYSFKRDVAADKPTHGQFIQNKAQLNQSYLEEINQWTENQKMEINQTKTKGMVINFTNNYQFTSRLEFKGEQIEIVDKTKILGVTVTNLLSWNENTQIIIKKVNQRMQLL